MSHGLAATIRGATESETFDLAGSNVATIETTIRDAFTEPFSLQEMIRLTFVTGAGKLGRARYDDGAARALTAALRECGYTEDRGASAVLECAGSFKLQHDTGKNLKTVVVFPKLLATATAGVEGGMSGLGLHEGGPILQEGTIDHKLAQTSMNVFPRMIESMCPTWSQKKGSLAAISELVGTAVRMDEKLMRGEVLTDHEQNFYDTVSVTSLQEKLACVRDLMHKQVDDGRITKDEKQQLLSQIDEKLATLTKEISEAENDAKAKRVENLKAAEIKAKARKEKLQSVNPIALPPLKNEGPITKLRKELKPLLDIEEGAKGRLMTLKESQSMARKDEILLEILELEKSSRGWFESDDIFQGRVETSRSEFEAKSKKSAKKQPTAGSGNGKSALPAAVNWVTPGTRKGAAWTKPAATKKPASTSLFAAMMNDSDSE